MVRTVLIHDGKPLDAFIARARFGDINDTGIEIARFPGNAFINLVGNLVCDAPPVVRLGAIGHPCHLVFSQNIPKAEFDTQKPVRFGYDPAIDECLCIDCAPLGKVRINRQRTGTLDKGFFVNRRKQTRSRQIIADHRCDVLADFGFRNTFTRETGNGDRHRLDFTAGDVDTEFGMRRCRGYNGQASDNGKGTQSGQTACNPISFECVGLDGHPASLFSTRFEGLMILFITGPAFHACQN